jgi:3-phosphoinositide dependent protein kinase-1
MASDGSACGTTMEPTDSKTPRQKRRDDFTLGDVLGQGAFGQVIKVTDKEDGKEFAMKILSKNHIVREKKTDYIKVERDVMNRCRHPNIIRLVLTFQDPSNLYYVIELARNGDLQAVLDERHHLNVECARVATGQILLGMAHMHQKRILHRDLKPENILLDEENRVKITDFGTAKIFDEAGPFHTQRGSFVGSADYVSPEILVETPVGPASDLWSFGCILFTLLVGTPPFHSESNYQTFQKIQELAFAIPDSVPADACDLIQNILRLEPSQRLGYDEFETDYAAIRNHPFYTGINWGTLPKTPMPPWPSSDQPPVESSKQPAPSKAATSSPGAEAQQAAPRVESSVGDLLDANEVSLIEGNIIKKRKLSTKKRRLVLTSKPRLFYVDMAKREMKGEIPLGRETGVKLGKGLKWAVEVPGRTYDLTSLDRDVTPQEWKTAIEKELAKLR